MHTQRTTPAPSVAYGVRSVVHESAGRLQRAPRLAPRDRAFLADLRRPDGSRIPKALERLVALACQAPTLPDALALVDGLRALIVAAHPATRGLDFRTLVQDEARADGRGAEAAAIVATDGLSVPALERLRDAFVEEALAAQLAADGCTARLAALQAAQAAPRRGIALVSGGRAD